MTALLPSVLNFAAEVVLVAEPGLSLKGMLSRMCRVMVCIRQNSLVHLWSSFHFNPSALAHGQTRHYQSHDIGLNV